MINLNFRVANLNWCWHSPIDSRKNTAVVVWCEARSAKEETRCTDAATEVNKTSEQLTMYLRFIAPAENKSTSSTFVWRWCALSYPTNSQNEMIFFFSFVLPCNADQWRKMRAVCLAASLLNELRVLLVLRFHWFKSCGGKVGVVPSTSPSSKCRLCGGIVGWEM